MTVIKFLDKKNKQNIFEEPENIYQDMYDEMYEDGATDDSDEDEHEDEEINYSQWYEI